jgi:hypothetical protein
MKTEEQLGGIMNKTIVLDCYEFESRLLIDEKMRADFLGDDDGGDIMVGVLEANSGDPDYFMMDGRRCSFFDYDYERAKYVVYISEGINEIAERMLKKFFAPDYIDHFSRESEHGESLRSWEDFESLQYAIAYRGGAGYIYTIWKYGKGE